MKPPHLLLASLLCILIAAPGMAREVDPLVGLWGTSIDFGRSLRGELTVRHERDTWTATVGGARATGVPAGQWLEFRFGDHGNLRARLVGKSLNAFWVQPGEPGAAGARQPYATPLSLRPVGASQWHGTIVPLQQRLTLWLSIFRTADGRVIAAFRNPETNANAGASRFAVSREGPAIRFQLRVEDTEITHDARFLQRPDRIRIDWPGLGRSVDFVRKNPQDAASFFPRPKGSRPYTYRPPPQLGDGWRTSRAAATGLDESTLQDIVRGIAASDPTERPPMLMQSILVAHHGRLVLEEYFFGFDRSTPHDIRSAGKTFASVLLGTEPARIAGLSPASRIYDVLAPLGPFANPDPRKAGITLSHLLTHTPGLACDDNDAKSPGNEGTMTSQRQQPNWWRYTLDLPMVHIPGTRYAYCSANMNLVGGALTHATADWLPDLFRRSVAEPLQFGRWYWNLSADGQGYLGGGAFLLPRDLLKVGQAYLNGGVWNGRRIVPAAWVRRSIQPAVAINPQTTGLSAEDFGNYYGEGRDGLAWHLGQLNANGRTFDTFAAGGNGGQVLLVVPNLDLVVVFTGGNYGQGGVWSRWGQQIVGDKIIPAIVKP